MKINMLLVIFVLAAVLPGLGAYLEMDRGRRLEHELKINCIKAGKDLVEGSCIGRETK